MKSLQSFYQKLPFVCLGVGLLFGHISDFIHRVNFGHIQQIAKNNNKTKTKLFLMIWVSDGHSDQKLMELA